MSVIRIPRKFFDDHGERELPCPRVLKETPRHVWIDTTEPAFESLAFDAEYYADEDGPDECPNVKRAAIALLAALKSQNA